jgi:hypothetical protein
MIQKIVKAVIPLFVWVTPEEQARRMKICALCKSRHIDKEVGWTCGQYLFPNLLGKLRTCGCIIREASKLKWKRCPQRKWSIIKNKPLN